MGWIVATWIGVGVYVVGAPAIWFAEHWYVGRKLTELRWIYHAGFYLAFIGCLIAYTWWLPPLLAIGMLIAAFFVQTTAFRLARRYLAPIRARHGVERGSAAVRYSQLMGEIAAEARRRGIDLDKPHSEQSPEEAAASDSLAREFEERLHKIGDEINDAARLPR